MENIMTLVVLAAGMGSRYGGLKQLDPITDNGSFIIDFTVYDAIKAGFDKVVFVIKRENYELFKETIGARIEKHIKVEYAFQELTDLPDGYKVPEGRMKPFGTAHAVLAARDCIDDNFAVVNADDFYGRDAFMKLGEHLSKKDLTEKGVSHCCMVGYELRNTLTENGTVSRGQCEIDGNGFLSDVTERTKIKQTDDGAAYEEDGKWISLSADTVVSMNCLGFAKEVIPHIQAGLVNFLDTMGDPLKSEYYIPTAIKEMINAKQADVKVYSTDAVWYGVTYHEDKEFVQKSIRNLIASGEYPENLWN